MKTLELWVQNKIQQKVKRIPIYPLTTLTTHTHILTISIPHQNDMFVTVDEPTVTNCCHQNLQFTLESTFGVLSLDKCIKTSIHHRIHHSTTPPQVSIMQITLHYPENPPCSAYPFLLPSPWKPLIFFHCHHRFDFSRVAYSWNHTNTN